MYTPGPAVTILFPILIGIIATRFVVIPIIIKKIRASYEPIESSMTETVHFCSHCGKKVSENTDTCTFCGAVPAGHHNFCGQCGVPLNPEQVICIRCGTMVPSGRGAGQLAPPPPGADIRQVNDYLEEAFIILLLFLPLGIAAIIFSVHTLKAKESNDYYRAVYCSNVTKKIVYGVRIIVAILGGVATLISLGIGIQLVSGN